MSSRLFTGVCLNPIHTQGQTQASGLRMWKEHLPANQKIWCPVSEWLSSESKEGVSSQIKGIWAHSAFPVNSGVHPFPLAWWYGSFLHTTV